LHVSKFTAGTVMVPPAN